MNPMTRTKRIIAIIKPHVAGKVFQALAKVPLEGPCNFHEAKGFGRQKNYLGLYRGSEYSTAYLPKVCLLLHVRVEHVDEVVETIVTSARSGRMGDGKIFIIDCDVCIPVADMPVESEVAE